MVKNKMFPERGVKLCCKILKDKGGVLVRVTRNRENQAFFASGGLVLGVKEHN